MRCRRIDSGGPSRSLKGRLGPGPEWRRQDKSGGRPASPQDYWPQRLLPRATSSIALARVRPRWEAARVNDRAAVESGKGSHSGALILGLSADGPQEAAAATAPTRVATARLLQPPVTPKEVQFRALFFESLRCWTGFSDTRCNDNAPRTVTSLRRPVPISGCVRSVCCIGTRLNCSHDPAGV